MSSFSDHSLFQWVKTDMNGDRAELEIDTAVNAFVNSLYDLTKRDNGKFLDIQIPDWPQGGLHSYVGGELPW